MDFYIPEVYWFYFVALYDKAMITFPTKKQKYVLLYFIKLIYIF